MSQVGPAAVESAQQTPTEPPISQNAESEAEQVTPTSAAAGPDAKGLQFAFEGVPWREVVKWLADESQLALHVGDLPTGSFTYSDPNRYTPQQAIDRVNIFLLPQGYTLVRSGQLLSVINLSDPRSMQQLNVLAKLVTQQQLLELEDQEVVKCFFPLERLTAEDAVEELSALNLMTTPSVFSKTNQLLITDTVAQLKNVKQVLDAFNPQTLDNGTVVKSFKLQYVSAEDVLVVARPHLGLATDEMIGIDVSLSADLQGENIFVTGIEDKVKLIEGLIESIDKPEKLATTAEDELRAHVVEGGNVELVYNVLQTLLAGRSVRLSIDEASGSVVALASPEIQQEIAETVAQLQSTDAVFEIIPLKTVDPYFAISLLESMLDLPDPLAALDDKRDSDSATVDPPRIDADPGNMRLFVRAKKHQVEQIKQIIDGLEKGSAGSAVTASEQDDLGVRVFPLHGAQAERALETAAKFWQAANPIVLFPSTVRSQAAATERVVADSAEDQDGVGSQSTANGSEGSQDQADAEQSNPRLLTSDPLAESEPIRCQVTPRGLLLQSRDTDALDQLEQLLRTVAGPTSAAPSPPVVFFLKYETPEKAIRMLAELLDGSENAMTNQAGSLVNSYVTSSGVFLGSLVTTSDGTMTMSSGTLTVVADPRLNRIIAQGTAADIEQIEGYLRIIDKDNSITSIETHGRSHVIELENVKASEVAVILREAYATRVAGATASNAARQPNQSGQPNAGRQPQPQPDRDRERREGEQQPDSRKANSKSGQSGKAASSPEPKMTIAVHELSNSLIVTAPEPLFREVEQLAKLIDSRSKRSVVVIPTQNAAAQMLLLEAVSNRVRVNADAEPNSNRKAAGVSPSAAGAPSRSSDATRSKSKR